MEKFGYENKGALVAKLVLVTYWRKFKWLFADKFQALEAINWLQLNIKSMRLQNIWIFWNLPQMHKKLQAIVIYRHNLRLNANLSNVFIQFY